MSYYLLAELEIDAAIDEFLRSRGITGQPQTIVRALDMDEEETLADTWRRTVNMETKKCLAHSTTR